VNVKLNEKLENEIINEKANVKLNDWIPRPIPTCRIQLEDEHKVVYNGVRNAIEREIECKIK
jgi:hypothetical protein